MLHRIEVRPCDDVDDPRSAAAARAARSVGVGGVGVAPSRVEESRVFLLEGPLSDPQLERVSRELLTDPITETAARGATPPRGDALVEVHPQPGVMDPDAEAIEQAIRAMLGVDVRVRTGRRYDMHGIDPAAALAIAERCFANRVIHGVTDRAYQPDAFPSGRRHEMPVREIPLRGLDDDALARLSRDMHLFLSVAEMRAIRSEYERLGRDPREIELETLAQTWSEHCVHKTLKAVIRYEGDFPHAPGAAASRPGHTVNPDGSITIDNLLRSTVAAATNELIQGGIDWCLSVFVDNAGVVAFDDEHAVCFKVETHNHPSALEPYGGAATGIGGCIRDVIGTGLAAKPIAATDVFCVAHADHFRQAGEAAGGPDAPVDARPLPAGCLHPARILREVVAGVRDYGNRMGIPTLNGAVWFDDDHVGNPLVFCGCVGILPRALVRGGPRAGDRIIALGGRTGRDGIHGATFSSAELTGGHADEFAHAVQIGNAVTEKKVLDAILEARDAPEGCLFHAITDCGAGGFSSAVGEMGAELGAAVDLDRAPLKYEGLSPTEIWISEAQERMVLAVPPENVEPLRSLCAAHDVETCDLGHFGTEDAELVLRHDAAEVGRLSMQFLHGGLPETTRVARWSPPPRAGDGARERDDAADPAVRGAAAAPGAGRTETAASLADALLAILAHPNVASKRWIIRQYDHEVQGRSVVRPLAGRRDEGPSDAAVIAPVRGSDRGLAIACGLATGLRDDPYRMTLAAIDECVRNLVCVGADAARIALLDNFCWPGCDDAESLGGLVRAAEACYDGAKAYRTPFISGKDSLNNQFTTGEGRTIRIPPTLLVSGFAPVPDVRRAVTMDAKTPGNLLLIAGTTHAAMGGSHYSGLHGDRGEDTALPLVDLETGPRTARAVHDAIARGLVRSAHDCSEGGLLVAAAEMALAGDLGLRLDLLTLPAAGELSPVAECFAETPSRYLLEIRRTDLDAVAAVLGGVPFAIIGQLDASRTLTFAGATLEIDDLRTAFLTTLDW